MPELTYSRDVAHTPIQMLELIADVGRYPEFLPNCTAMHVTPDAEAPDSRCNARMHVKFGPIEQAYTSRVEVDREAMTVTADAIDGPFSKLHNHWHFEPKGEGARITCHIDFKIRNPLLAAAAEPAFASKQDEVVDAFVRRADEIYG